MKRAVGFTKKSTLLMSAMMLSTGLIAQPFETTDSENFNVNLDINQLFLITNQAPGDVDLAFDGINDEVAEVEFCVYTNGDDVTLRVESNNGNATDPRLYDGVGEYVIYAITLENATPSAVAFDSADWSAGAEVTNLAGAAITGTLNAGACDTTTLTLTVTVDADDMAAAELGAYSDVVTLTIEAS